MTDQRIPDPAPEPLGVTDKAKKVNLDIVITCSNCRRQGIVTAEGGVFHCPCGTDTTREEVVRKALDETWDEDEASMRYLADR